MGKKILRRPRAAARGSRWNSAARRRTSSSRTRRWSSGRGHRQRHLLQPGPRLLRRLAAARAGVGEDLLLDRLRRRLARSGSATRWTRTPTSARSTPARSWTRSASCPAPARPRARSAGRHPARCPTAALVPADAVHRRSASPTGSPARKIFGPVLSVLTFRTPQEAVAKANNTPYGLSAGVWTEKGSRIRGWPSGCGLRGWANTITGSTGEPVRGLPRVRVRPRGRLARPGGLPRCLSQDERRIGRLAVRKTYKLSIGGAFPRSESGRVVPGSRTGGALLGNAAQASRKDARTRSPPPAGGSAVAAARPPTTAARCSTGSPRCSRAGRESSPLRWPRPSVGEPGAAVVAAAIDRWVWYAGWPDKVARSPAAPTRWRGRTSTSACPSRPGWSRSWPRRSESAGPGRRRRAGHRDGNTAVVWPAARPLPAVDARRGAGHLRHAGRVVNSEAPHCRAGACWSGGHGRQRDGPHRGARPAMPT